MCVLHFARVRDRLLELHAWKFARKVATVEDGAELPTDCLAVLMVCVDGVPVEYEQRGMKLDVKGTVEVHYTAKITDISQWSGIFCDVFCCSLAEEICPAVTGEPQYTQILEAKIQELLRRAYQTGAIQPETRLTLKQEIYNRAIGLSRGQRTVTGTGNAAVEQGIDIQGVAGYRTQTELNACIRASGSVRDRLLGLYPWSFAHRSTELAQTTAAIEGWTNGYVVPSDCVKVLVLVKDGAVIDHEEGGGCVYCNASAPTLRYTARVEDMSKWPGMFVDVYVYSLAQEIVLSTTNDANTLQLLERKAAALIVEARRMGLIRTEIRIPLKEELYAIQPSSKFIEGKPDVRPVE